MVVELGSGSFDNDKLREERELNRAMGQLVTVEMWDGLVSGKNLEL